MNWKYVKQKLPARPPMSGYRATAHSTIYRTSNKLPYVHSNKLTAHSTSLPLSGRLIPEPLWEVVWFLSTRLFYQQMIDWTENETLLSTHDWLGQNETLLSTHDWLDRKRESAINTWLTGTKRDSAINSWLTGPKRDSAINERLTGPKRDSTMWVGLFEAANLFMGRSKHLKGNLKTQWNLVNISVLALPLFFLLPSSRPHGSHLHGLTRSHHLSNPSLDGRSVVLRHGRFRLWFRFIR